MSEFLWIPSITVDPVPVKPPLKTQEEDFVTGQEEGPDDLVRKLILLCSDNIELSSYLYPLPGPGTWTDQDHENIQKNTRLPSSEKKIDICHWSGPEEARTRVQKLILFKQWYMSEFLNTLSRYRWPWTCWWIKQPCKASAQDTRRF